MDMATLLGKSRRPKFELHLKIYDLNNVPLVSGNSYIKWHLAHSIRAEHRGRTTKCSIIDHKVDYGYSKIIPMVRLSLDKHNNLSEYPFELEVLQEFAGSEKMTLGLVRLNLSEYVGESQKRSLEQTTHHSRRRSSLGTSPTSGGPLPPLSEQMVRDGIVRRYLMQDSKVNSTLKISILMVQVDGERNFVAPPLKTAPVFGSIAGLITPEQGEDEVGPLPSISKPRDHFELQDLYRHVLAASWVQDPSEPTVDESIEDIFCGGNGWRQPPRDARCDANSDDEDEGVDFRDGTLRAAASRRPSLPTSSSHHSSGRHDGLRAHSISSERSASHAVSRLAGPRRGLRFARDEVREDDASRSGSLGSLAPTTGSGSDLDLAQPPRGWLDHDLHEMDIRDDLMAWTFNSTTAS